MRTYVVAVALLFIALGEPLYAQSSSAAPPADPAPAAPAAPVAPAAPGLVPTEVMFELLRSFQLNCTSPIGVNGSPYTWKINGSLVEAREGSHVNVSAGGALLAVARATEADHGAYECLARGSPVRAWALAARAVAKLPPDTNVVEGQKLKLTCKLVGRPYPPVAWYYAPPGSNDTRDAAEWFGERAAAADSADGVPGGQLTLDAVRASDAGNYTCAPRHGVPDSTTLRVKDMYAALWPFLGICAEVLVLCAIILLYEKRRTKPELDDSDTDNHDQ